MLEQLINSLKSEVGGQIMNQTNLPSGHLDQVFSVIGDVTKKEVTGHMLGGNLSGSRKKDCLSSIAGFDETNNIKKQYYP